jgi:hypothetical protein
MDLLKASAAGKHSYTLVVDVEGNGMKPFSQSLPNDAEVKLNDSRHDTIPK